MKTVKKIEVDRLIRYTKRWWLGSDEDDLNAMLLQSEALGRQTGIEWTAWLNIMDSIFKADGLNNAATNEQVYQILNILGWEVVEE